MWIRRDTLVMKILTHMFLNLFPVSHMRNAKWQKIKAGLTFSFNELSRNILNGFSRP